MKYFKVGLGNRLKEILSKVYYGEIKNARNFTREEFETYQNQQLEEILKYATNHVPYYKNNSEKYDLTDKYSNNIKENLRKLPLLAKEVVKKENDLFWSDDINNFTKFHTTSGTSGTPLRIPFKLNEKLKSNANLNYWYKTLNVKKGWKLWLSGFMTPTGGQGDLYQIDTVNKNIYLSIYALNVNKEKEILNLFKKYNPMFIYGYASAVHQLAILIKNSKQIGDAFRIDVKKRVCIVTSEVLYQEWREDILQHIGRVYNLYGSQEGNHLVQECIEGSFHINPLIGIVEILDDEGKEAKEGEKGNVVVTGLNKKSMPLIRYKIGDIANTSVGKICGCGLNWPIIGNIEGRSEDLVIKKDGSKIGYLCFHATKEIKEIKEAQLIQENYDLFTFNLLLMEESYSYKKNIENQILKELRKRLNSESFIVNFNYPSHIKRGGNGKFKAVVVKDFIKNENKN